MQMNTSSILGRLSQYYAELEPAADQLVQRWRPFGLIDGLEPAQAKRAAVGMDATAKWLLEPGTRVGEELEMFVFPYLYRCIGSLDGESLPKLIGVLVDNYPAYVAAARKRPGEDWEAATVAEIAQLAMTRVGAKYEPVQFRDQPQLVRWLTGYTYPGLQPGAERAQLQLDFNGSEPECYQYFITQAGKKTGNWESEIRLRCEPVNGFFVLSQVEILRIELGKPENLCVRVFVEADYHFEAA
jgi:hypothetical protein